MTKKDHPLGALEVLEYIRKDIKEMEWEKLSDDGIRVLVGKSDVLDIVQDWIEYCLNPDQTVLAKSEHQQ